MTKMQEIKLQTAWPTLSGFTVWIRRCHLEYLLIFQMAPVLKVIVHTAHTNKHRYSVHNTETQFFHPPQNFKSVQMLVFEVNTGRQYTDVYQHLG